MSRARLFRTREFTNSRIGPGFGQPAEDVDVDPTDEFLVVRRLGDRRLGRGKSFQDQLVDLRGLECRGGVRPSGTSDLRTWPSTSS